MRTVAQVQGLSSRFNSTFIVDTGMPTAAPPTLLGFMVELYAARGRNLAPHVFARPHVHTGHHPSNPTIESAPASTEDRLFVDARVQDSSGTTWAGRPDVGHLRVKGNVLFLHVLVIPIR